MLDLLTEEKVLNLLKDLKDPFLHKSLEETNGIIEMKIKPEKNHVSVKLAIAKTGTAEQMQMQSEVVDLLKERSRICRDPFHGTFRRRVIQAS